MRTRALGSALDCPERPRREREDFFCCGAAGAGSAVWGTGSLAGWVRGFFSPRLPPLRRAGFFSAPFSSSAGISGSEEAVASNTAAMASSRLFLRLRLGCGVDTISSAGFAVLRRWVRRFGWSFVDSPSWVIFVVFSSDTQIPPFL